MLQIGVLGAGHLGNIHLNNLKESEQFELIGFFDPDEEKAVKAEQKHNIQRFNSVEEVIDNADVVDIVTPTLSHFDCAEKALKKTKHVFIEKPITNTVEEAKTLMELAKEANVKVQVGHVERFNPAYVAARPFCGQPMFIETHRLAEFNPRGTDVSVVLDLMIHDIDIVLSLVKSSVKRISASGVAVVSDTPDIANARIEFDNGCVANLTSSRISLKNMRKTRLFQRDAYISIDFLEKKSEIVRLKEVNGEPDPHAMVFNPGEGKKPKQIFFDSPEIEETNAIKDELESFANAINNNIEPLVTIEDGYHALDVAYKVLDKMKMTSELVTE
ncbi:MAG: oxidoreductase [Flavobacteriales bacterium]|nr:MAG: oxidoreductase [Flavobacteriales bacterium]